MANSSLGYTEPGSPNKRLYSRSFTEDAVTKDAQGIFICDASGNIVSVTSNRLVVDASGVPVPVTDNSGSLTVDAPVGTPAFVRLSDGTSAIATLPVDSELPAAAALGDSMANPTTPMVGAAAVSYNPANAIYERHRSVAGYSLLSSAARTATTAAADTDAVNWRGVTLMVNVTAGTGFSILPYLQGKEYYVSNVYFDLHGAPTPIVATGMYVYELYPGIGAASGGVTMRTSATVPRRFRANIVHGNANSVTYSVAFVGVV